MLRKLGKLELRRVSEWAKKELHDLRKNSPEAICVALKGGNYTVGTYLVERQDKYWLAAGHVFGSKKNAIFYCAFLHTKKYADADNLLQLDQRISALEADKELFRFRLDKAHVKQDEWEIGLYSSRYEVTKDRLKAVKHELEKILNCNKYLNTLG